MHFLKFLAECQVIKHVMSNFLLLENGNTKFGSQRRVTHFWDVPKAVTVMVMMEFVDCAEISINLMVSLPFLEYPI